jgi:hypothetical protein
MKKARDVHGLLDSVDLTVNTDADREVLEKVLRASRKSTASVSQGDAPRILAEAGQWRFVFWRKAGYLAAALLVISSLLACFVLSGRVAGLRDKLELARQDVPPARPDETTTINLYLKEHRDVVARHASFGAAAPQPVQMYADQHDVMYYEPFDGGSEYMYPGIIVRASSPRRETEASEAPVISNGHTLTLSEARETAGFNLVSPSWLRPAYALDEIRRIEGRDALQLLYTDGIDSVSLFEQTLDGQRGLSAKDFREYAVYRNTEQAGGTILAWKDDELSYVLIGNIEMSQLMDMAQSISAGK